MLEKYHKIDSIFKRDQKGKFLFGDYSKEYFSYLKDNTWVGTEKIDGTNIRLYRNALSSEIEIHGRNDNSQIPTHLLDKLKSICDNLLSNPNFNNLAPDRDITFFGEGYGYKIQKNGSKYLKNDVDFICFDIKIGDLFLRKEDVFDICDKLEINHVSIVFKGNLYGAIDFVTKGFDSALGDLIAEGLVLIPEVDLNDRSNHRIITKIKYRDFK